jgi:hypothetical protein
MADFIRRIRIFYDADYFASRGDEERAMRTTTIGFTVRKDGSKLAARSGDNHGCARAATDRESDVAHGDRK